MHLASHLNGYEKERKGFKPLHWQLAFPDVFSRPEPGFDVFVGNPPVLLGSEYPHPGIGEGS